MVCTSEQKIERGNRVSKISQFYMMEKRQLCICAEDLTWKKMRREFSFDSSPNYSNSLGVEVDADNRKLFEDFEKKLQSLTGDGELKLIKYGRV